MKKSTRTFRIVQRGEEPTRKPYGLPPLTFAEAARLVGISEGDFIRWVLETIKPSSSQWNMWTTTNPKTWRPLPDALLRLYLARLRQASPSESSGTEARS